MEKITIQLSKNLYREKPSPKETGAISVDIVKNIETVDIEYFISEVGEKGRVFLPAMLKNRRTKNNFVSQQFWCLDFDDGLTVQEFFRRAEEFDIMPLFVYETYHYTHQHERFRAVFYNNIAITDREVAERIILALLHLFPEADRQCKDVSRMFYGGRKIIYKNTGATVSYERILLALQAYIRDRDPKNAGRKMKEIAKKLGLKVHDGLLVLDSENLHSITEESSVETYNIYDTALFSSNREGIDQEGKSSSLCKYSIIRDRNLDDLMMICPLLKEFYESEEDLHHNQKFLLATNLRYIAGGKKIFFDGLKEHRKTWNVQWEYIRHNNPEFPEKSGSTLTGSSTATP